MKSAESGRPSPDAGRLAWVEWARAAGDAGDWQSALERWEQCIAKFGPQPQWLARKGAALAELNRTEEAERLFQTLAKETPGDPAGLLGLANLAARRHDWSDALSLLTRCREAHPGAGTALLARVLVQLGRLAESEELWSRLLEQEPGNRKLQVMQLRAAVAARRQEGSTLADHSELAGQIERLVFPGDEDFDIQAIGLLDALGERGRAAKQLLDSVGRVRSLKYLAACFRAIPLHIERGSRGPLWESLLARVRTEEDESGSPSPAALGLELCLLLALERFGEFCARFDALESRLPETPGSLLLERVRERLGKPRREVFAEAKVFGIGLTKTGTNSLNEALNILDIDAAHWANPLTHQPILDIDIYMFGAATDTCISSRFEQLYHLYPNARFVWTRRPVESWIQSFSSHHARANWAADFNELRAVYEREDSPFGFSSAVIQFGLYFNSASPLDAYLAHEERVRHFFSEKPAGKLLELDLFAGQGWPELCAFLGRPQPDRTFPWSNRGGRKELADDPATGGVN